MFRHILIDEMQDTNALQVEIVETIAAAGAGNLTAVGDDAQSIYRFRGANYDNILKFPERHPRSRTFMLDVNYRSTPQIVAFTDASIRHNRSGFPKELVSARAEGLKPVVAATADVYEEADLVCQQILEARDKEVPLGQMAVLYRNHYDSVVLQGELVTRGIPYTVRSGLRFFEQAHIKDVLAHLRVVVNPRDEASWRRVLLLLPGIGPAKAAALYQLLAGSADPLAALASAEAMAAVPPRSKGFFAAFVNDVRQIAATDPERHPAAAIEAILKGGYPATLRQKYDRADNRIADLEQFAVLAAKYESLERLLAELLLAGDVYGMDTMAAAEPGRRAGPEHGPPGQGPGMVPRLPDPADRGQLSSSPGAGGDRGRGRGTADLLRGGQPGDERADPDVSLHRHPRRLWPHGLRDAQPVPHGACRGAVRTGRAGARVRRAR